MKRKIVSCFLTLCMAVMLVPNSAVNAEYEDELKYGGYLYYEINEDKTSVTITGYETNATGEIVIPEKIDGYPVTHIGEGAFEGCNHLTNITIPNSVTDIGESAFWYCRDLKDIQIHNQVNHIGSSAFSGTAFYNDASNWENGVLYLNNYLIETKSDEVPTVYSVRQGTTLLAEYVFAHCELESIIIPNSVISIGSGAFQGCKSLKSVKLNEGLINISDIAFADCYALTDIRIPNSVTTMGSYVFDRCLDLKSITIPENVTSIGDNPFSFCDLEIYVEADNKYYASDKGVLFSKDKTELIGYAKSEISPTYIIPNYVTKIGNGAFLGCTDLTDITIPMSVKTIGDRAFERCAKITAINIPDNVNTIGKYAFEDCWKLVKINIPTNVTVINKGTFSGCHNLQNIDIPDNIDYIGYDAFCNCYSLEKIYIPDSVTSIDSYAFYNCDSLVSISIGNGVVSIGYNAFVFCDAILDVYYSGTEDEWNEILIEDGNEYLTEATIHYNSSVRPTPNPTPAPVSTPTPAPTPTPSTKFTMLRDNFSFANTRSSFGYGSDYKIPLERYTSLFGTTKGTYQYNTKGIWKGSCYGFSTATALFFDGRLDYTQYSLSAKCLFDLSAPKTPKSNLTELLELCQISYALEAVSNEHMGNRNDMNSIVRAVQHFEETGEDPIMLSMFGESSGHTVVPYKCVANSDGSYSIYVYDNNYPTSEDRIVTINSDMKSFIYGKYDNYINFNYADTVYRAMRGGISMYAEEQDDSLMLTVNADDVEITDTNGVSIDKIKGAYEVIPVEPEIDTTQKIFVVPNGDYLIENNNDNLDELEIHVANSKDYQQIRTDDIKAVVSVGVYTETGRVYANIASSKISNNSIKTLNDTGVSKLFEAVGTTLGASATDSSTVEIEADSLVIVNGQEVNVGSAGDVGSASVSTYIDTSSSGSGEDFETVTNKNKLTYSDGLISGDLSYLIYNNTDTLAEARVIAALYSDDGRLVSVIKNDNEVLALGSNYIDLGSLIYSGLSESAYYVKCFVWNSVDSMQPLAAVNRIDIQ